MASFYRGYVCWAVGDGDDDGDDGDDDDDEADGYDDDDNDDMTMGAVWMGMRHGESSR